MINTVSLFQMNLSMQTVEFIKKSEVGKKLDFLETMLVLAVENSNRDLYDYSMMGHIIVKLISQVSMIIIYKSQIRHYNLWT